LHVYATVYAHNYRLKPIGKGLEGLTFGSEGIGVAGYRIHFYGDGHIREDVYHYKLFNKDEGG